MRKTTKRYLLFLIFFTIINVFFYIFSIEYLKNYCSMTSNINHVKRTIINEQKKELLQKQSIDIERKECVNKNKYIRYECKRPLCGGWADRLRGLMSAYIWANFTNREFLIDMNYPCSLSLMLEPNVIKWNRKIQCYDMIDENDDFKNTKFTSIRLDKVSNKNFYALLRSIDISEYYKEANLITIRNNLDWIYSFTFNKLVHQNIQQYGYKKPEEFRLYYFFRKLYGDMFKLTPKLQKRYDEFLHEAKPDNNTKLICAQIRIGGARPNVAFDVQFTQRNNSKLFWKFMREKFIDANPKQKYKIFVTTDTESVEEESIEEFGKENIVRFDGPFVHIDREAAGNVNDCSRVEKIFLDFHAIQSCDIAIISQSGFGRLGISNRPEPAKDLYRFEKNPSIPGAFIFKKIETLNML